MQRSLALAVVVTLLAAAACFAQPLRTRYDRAFYAPSEEVVTPHIPWARPNAGGPVKALFLIHRQNQREVIELAQRLEMDYTVFCAETPDKFGETGIGVDASWRLVQGNSAEEMTEQLLGYLEDDYDVIVVGNIKWDEFPIECRYHVLRKVKAGTGLVGYMPRGHDVYLERILGRAKFHWGYNNWSGAARDVPDYFGIGDFVGSVDTTEPRSGECAVRIVGREVAPGSRESPRGGFTLHPVTVEPHTRYRFSAWYKTADGGQAGISLHPMPAGVPTPASEEWRQTEVEWDTGEQTTFGVYLLNYAVGTVWYDDVSLVKVGEEDKNLLPNPGFEHPGPAPEALQHGVPFPALPAFARYDTPAAFSRGTFQTARFGEGRIALLGGFGVPLTQIMTPAPQGPMRRAQLDYDYYLAAGIKAILWAARKEPAVEVRTPEPRITVSREDLPGSALPFELVARDGAGEYGYVFTLRDRVNRAQPAGAGVIALHEGAATLSPTLRAQPAGSYFVDLKVIPRGEVELIGAAFTLARPTVVGFGSIALEVTSEAHIGELALARPDFSQHEPITGTVTVENPPEGAVVHLSAWDNLGRLLGEANVPAVADVADFSIPTVPARAIMGRVEARLVNGEDTFDVAEGAFSVRDLHPDPDDMRHVLWESPGNDFISPYILREFRKHGVDTQYTNFREMIPEANLWHIPYAIRFVDTKTDWYQLRPTREPGDLVRDPCLTDPAYLEKVRETLTSNARHVSRYSTSDFSLGDECHFVAGNWDLCMSDTCNADFREWLRREYGTLEAVNEQWGTQYENWADVVPIALQEARETGRVSQWVDHRRHMEDVWAGIYHFSRDVIREVVPDARVGYEGSDTHIGSFTAADYWKLAQAMEYNNIYYRDFLANAVRDFAAPDTLLGLGWYGGYPGNRNETYMRWFPWRALFKGANSLWIWMGFGTAGGVIGYDLSMYPFYAANCEEVNAIKAGPAKLLLSSERQHDGIALLWSASSVYAAHLTNGFPSLEATLDSWVRIFHNLGLECRVVSYEQLAQGAVTTDEFRALVLPGAQALSREEAEATRAFAAAGGHVIADLRPGVRDPHGKPYPEGILDDLFGVRQDTAEFAPVVGEVAVEGGGELRAVTADGGLTLAGAQAAGTLGEAPVLISRDAAPGRAVLLNLSLSGYIAAAAAGAGDFGGWPVGAPARGLVARLLGEAGITPAVRISPELPQVEISRFSSGEAQYVGMVQGLPRSTADYTNRVASPPTPRPATVVFPRAAHVYDVRAREYLGETARVETQVQPGVARLFALLPYRVARLTCTAPGVVPRGARVGYSVRVDAARHRPGTHCIRVEALNPAGTLLGHYSANIMAPEGRGEGGFTLAHNDPVGTWTLRAVDVATGTQAETRLEVRER